jgi:hypothetical protein
LSTLGLPLPALSAAKLLLLRGAVLAGDSLLLSAAVIDRLAPGGCGCVLAGESCLPFFGVTFGFGGIFLSERVRSYNKGQYYLYRVLKITYIGSCLVFCILQQPGFHFLTCRKSRHIYSSKRNKCTRFLIFIYFFAIVLGQISPITST